MSIVADHTGNLEEEILFLKKKHNAVILSHFYQNEDIQDISAFIGDALDLSKKAFQLRQDSAKQETS